MYGGIGNSLLVGCLLKFPVMIPVIALTGGIFYSAVCDTPPVAPSAPMPEVVKVVAPAPAPVVTRAVIVTPPPVVEPPKVVPQPLPPKKIKG